MADYSKELRMGADIKRKGKVEKEAEFAERIKKDTRGSKNNIEKSTGEDEVTNK